MNDAYVCLGYSLCWALVTLWSIQHWLPSPFGKKDKEENDEDKGTLQTLLNFVSGRFIVIFSIVIIVIFRGIDLLGLLIAKAYLHHYSWVDEVTMILMVLIGLIIIRDAYLTYRLMSRVVEHDDPDAYMTRFKNLNPTPWPIRYIERALGVVYLGFSVYMVFFLLKVVGIL